AVGAENGRVVVWDLSELSPVAAFDGRERVTAVALDARGRMMASQASREPLRVRDLATGRLTNRDVGQDVETLAFAENGDLLVAKWNEVDVLAPDTLVQRRSFP